MRTLKVILFLALLSITRAVPSEELYCTPELEGRLMKTASGALVGVPFSGQVLVRETDGSTKPAMEAWIVRLPERCPNLKASKLELSSEGHFDYPVNLSTDTHWYCINGKVKQDRSVESLSMKVIVPGCGEATVQFSLDSSPDPIQVDCVEARGESFSKHRPEARTVAEVSKGSLHLDGVEVELPSTIDSLMDILGPPTEVIPANGDRWSNDVYEWEQHGIYCFVRADGRMAHAIVLVLEPANNTRQWCFPGMVNLIVNGVPISSDSKIEDVVAAGFSEGSVFWELRYPGIYYLLDSYGDPEVFGALEVGVPTAGR